ncbi:MAG TPA: 8-amino-7-oxononanoate synthase [Chitinophagaceae bacterium]|nr:8-amino-7-oxononanoate synthase [Chitinophagaceae bacterium]
MNEDFLLTKITARKEQDAYRQLQVVEGLIDFCSNDYLGMVKNAVLNTHGEGLSAGSTGSRLLSGNSRLAEETESFIAGFHHAPAALLFNAGYDANLGLLSAVPQRGDTVLYDALSHASLRDGLRLSLATAWPFAHNDMDALRTKIATASGNIFVVTESVFSMDGDQAPLPELVDICQLHRAHLVVDEAHATGVVGSNGEGLAQYLQLEQYCFARIHTFGKALGCHGAAVLGSTRLRDYLVNFSRPFIYTTALPPVAVAAIQESYRKFPAMHAEREQLRHLIALFRKLPLGFETLSSETAVQSVIIPGNTQAKQVARACRQAGFDIRAILYPTVPKGRERLRIVLHAFNTEKELQQLAVLLQQCWQQLQAGT